MFSASPRLRVPIIPPYSRAPFPTSPAKPLVSCAEHEPLRRVDTGPCRRKFVPHMFFRTQRSDEAAPEGQRAGKDENASPT